MLELPRLSQPIAFPPVQQALSEPNGLLAFGGDLSVERLYQAYRSGIFPWYSEGEPILWWSPDPRGVMLLDDFHCSKSLAKLVRQQRYQVSINRDFEQVILACANIPRHDAGTWITDDMLQAYIHLHQAGHAHAVEVWQQQQLVGGLYGVAVGGAFCGESMFHTQNDCSKLACYYLVKHLKAHGGSFIDCQMPTPHLTRLGCNSISRDRFLRMLNQAIQQPMVEHCWHAQWLT